jgi:uncharacterized membrane protein YidH (DUF202 family)
MQQGSGSIPVADEHAEPSAGSGSKLQVSETSLRQRFASPCNDSYLGQMEQQEVAMAETAADVARCARTIDRFSRLTSELSNERTLLSWVRTGLAAIRTVFPFFDLIEKTDPGVWKMTVTFSQLAMMTVVIFAGLSGSVRYNKVREALRSPEPPDGFGRVSVWWFNGLVIVSYFAIGIGIYTLNWN